MAAEKIIGVIAGAGPFAGLDLLGKILEQTRAEKDQDHLTVISLSRPNQILDRTEYLLGQVAENPAYAIAGQLKTLAQMGATVAGIPCNTAHAPPIFDVILEELHATNLKLLHMIQEVGGHLSKHHPHIKRVGILSTTGTAKTGLYPQVLEPVGFEVLLPGDDLQEQVIHTAVYHPHYGIKACGTVTETARNNLLQGARALQQKGAEALILGCTEIPLAIKEQTLYGMDVIDPTLILARALIREVDRAKLRRWSNGVKE